MNIILNGIPASGKSSLAKVLSIRIDEMDILSERWFKFSYITKVKYRVKFLFEACVHIMMNTLFCYVKSYSSLKYFINLERSMYFLVKNSDLIIDEGIIQNCMSINRIYNGDIEDFLTLYSSYEKRGIIGMQYVLTLPSDEVVHRRVSRKKPQDRGRSTYSYVHSEQQFWDQVQIHLNDSSVVFASSKVIQSLILK